MLASSTLLHPSCQRAHHRTLLLPFQPSAPLQKLHLATRKNNPNNHTTQILAKKSRTRPIIQKTSNGVPRRTNAANAAEQEAPLTTKRRNTPSKACSRWTSASNISSKRRTNRIPWPVKPQLPRSQHPPRWNNLKHPIRRDSNRTT